MIPESGNLHAAKLREARQPPTTAPFVSLVGVSKRFSNGTLALSDLDLDVFEGEFLTLLGPSGCGKSTVLRMIAGLATPSEGRIAWRSSGAAPAPQIGFVFQEPTLTPWSNVFSNVWLPLRLQGVSRRQAAPRVEEVLAQVGLEQFARALPRELSGGMKMRVSIARALVLRPALLLMDEPFAALDEITRFRLNDDLLRLKETLDATIVFVTHSVFESVYLSTRIAIISARPGRVAHTVPIQAPARRDSDFRGSAYYAEQCREASRALEAAMMQERQR